MIFSGRLWISIGALTGAAACSGVVTPPEPPREGSPAKWSLSVPTGANTTAVVGTVAVIKNDRSLLGVDSATGRELWRLPAGEKDAVDLTEDVIVLRDRTTAFETKAIPFSVIDLATGRTLWRDTPTDALQVSQDAIFSTDCRQRTDCVTTRRDPRTGKTRWSVPSGVPGFADTFVGVRRPFAPATAAYTVAEFAGGGPLGSGRETGTGRRVRGRLSGPGWYDLVVGRTLVGTDHDPPSGDTRCTVRVTSVDAVSGRTRWTREVFSGRLADDSCQKRLVPDSSGLTLIGRGSRIAASTAGGAPQVFDLASGRTVWRGDASGVPIDGDGRSLLVRRQADSGPLSLLDFTTGRTLWTAPDPGLSGQSASWASAVTGRLVAVSGADGDRPHVLVYRADTGRRIGRFPGWLEGLGDDWVAIGHSAHQPTVGELTLDFIRL
ncbi:MAG: PQQ-binding-like beta-propeller repeat protein [Actinomadura sp.]